MLRRIRILGMILVGVVFTGRFGKSLLTPMLTQQLARAEAQEYPFHEEWMERERRRMMHQMIWWLFDGQHPHS